MSTDDTGSRKGHHGVTGKLLAAPSVLRHRVGLAAGGALLVAALVALALIVGGDDDNASSASTGATAVSRAPSPEEATGGGATHSAPAPGPGQTAQTEDAYFSPTALPGVGLDAAAAVGNGIVATVPEIVAIESTATGPGNVAGPALRVTVRIANGTGEPVALDGVIVNMAYGPEITPASPLDDPSQRPFAGTVAPGDAAEGIYVFSVPEDRRDSVTVEVGYQPGAPLLIFTGSAG